MSDYPKNITEALIAFHGQVPSINKDKQGQRSAYATLANILSIVTPVLNKCGLVLTQEFLEDSLVTTLRHVSGETISSSCTLAIPNGPHATQAWGSAVTYQRRYAVCAILSLVAEMDEQNDPDAIQPAQQQQQTKPAPKKTVAKKKSSPSSTTTGSLEPRSAPAPTPTPAPKPANDLADPEKVKEAVEKLRALGKKDAVKFQQIKDMYFAHFKIGSDCYFSESIHTHDQLKFVNDLL